VRGKKLVCEGHEVVGIERSEVSAIDGEGCGGHQPLARRN